MSVISLSPNSPHALSAFPSIFAEALNKYKAKTGTDLPTHPLFTEIKNCDTAEKVIAVLVGTCNALDDARKTTVVKWIKPMVHVLMSVTSVVGGGSTVVSARVFACVP